MSAPGTVKLNPDHWIVSLHELGREATVIAGPNFAGFARQAQAGTRMARIFECSKCGHVEMLPEK
jgi:hypothetical protein